LNKLLHNSAALKLFHDLERPSTPRSSWLLKKRKRFVAGKGILSDPCRNLGSVLNASEKSTPAPGECMTIAWGTIPGFFLTLANGNGENYRRQLLL
jgi:hypothetical protein